jgi:uncharacterized protein YecE (DUF72 family)
VTEDVRLHVGCAMWSHPAWPRDRRQLATYATWCNAVEGNTTFYGVPGPSTVASWAEQAPADFRFVFKFPRSVTHERRLRDTGREVAEFLDAVAPLGDRVWTVTAQLPASFGPPDLGTLVAFLAGLPQTFRYAVEVRHPRFFDGSPSARALARVVHDHGVEWVGFDTTVLFGRPPTSDGEREAWSNKPRLPRRTDAVTDRPIVRYIGRDDPAATTAGWAPWLPVVAGWLAEGRHPTVFVHTPDNADALGLAREFHAAVGRLVPPLAPLPEPARPEPTTLF